MGSSVVLYDFCLVDFTSYDPKYFGYPREFSPGRDLVLFREIENPQVGKDKYCVECNRRLAFLRFLADLRERAAKRGSFE
jgi:hypothetical protein